MPSRSGLTRLPRWVLLVLLVYALSFALPHDERNKGWHLFVLGLLYFYLPWGWPWLANPLLWVSLRASWLSPLLSFLFAGLSLVMAASFLIVLYLSEIKEMPGPAYWVWLGSMAIATLGSGAQYYFTHPGADTNRPQPYPDTRRIASPEPTDLGIQK